MTISNINNTNLLNLMVTAQNFVGVFNSETRAVFLLELKCIDRVSRNNNCQNIRVLVGTFIICLH